MPRQALWRTAVAATFASAWFAVPTSLPHAQADPSTVLTQAVSAARASSQCAPLQWDSLVERAAAMANEATAAYISHRSAAVPFTDPLPALATIGYTASKGIVLAGYGATEADALQAFVLQYQGTKPDCEYSQFGTDMRHDDAGSTLIAVVLTVPAGRQ